LSRAQEVPVQCFTAEGSQQPAQRGGGPRKPPSCIVCAWKGRLETRVERDFLPKRRSKLGFDSSLASFHFCDWNLCQLWADKTNMTSAHYMFCQLFDEMFTQYWTRALFAQSASDLWRALGFSAANIVTAVPPEHICSMPMTTLLEENRFFSGAPFI
jgi:hypothetical protein